MELLPDESSGYNDPVPFKQGSEVAGAIIDRMSGVGSVLITGKGYNTMKISTGGEKIKHRYQDVKINPKQCCMLHHDAVVLYYRERRPNALLTPKDVDAAHSVFRINDFSAEALSPGVPIVRSSSAQSPSYASSNNSRQIAPHVALASTHTAEQPSGEINILFRLQFNQMGMFSALYGKSILRPSVTATAFFEWFGTQAGCETPTQLKFTFKDAMPAPYSTRVAAGNEDHFRLMRKDIKMQCTKAGSFMPGLREFVVLISVPGWDMPVEEDW